MHHFNIFSLLAWASIDKCYLCQILLERLKQIYGESLDPTNFETFRTEVCWSQDCWSRDYQLEEKDTLYFVMTDPSRKRGFWNFNHYFKLGLWPTPTYLSNFMIPADLESRKIFPSTQSRTSRALAVSWLSRCKANEGGTHEECNKRDLGYLPTRLLDVKYAQKTARLRLVCPALDRASFAEGEEWMTLSYCWGTWGAKHNPILTKRNLGKRQKVGLSLEYLPKTFQDVLEIAGWLNS